MIVIRCHECKRKYNWAGDAFCPHCGAFNQAEDYSFDRERVAVKLEDDEPEKVLFQRKKTATGHANQAPNRPVPPKRYEASPKRTNQQQADPAQAKGCLRKIIIAVVVWNVAMVVLGMLSNFVFSLF
ncbi:hypothetical protein RFF05_07620 [Bengtsoniella intestinalis]|uniref:hypothetical protein n=1 Tax=Bengtsoniella intestinalis TaxID=3073143 RepID=UPI00391EE345